MNAKRTLSLALAVAALVGISPTLACGGGGSSSYRKPAKPGQHQSNSPAASSEKETAVPKGFLR
jgi:hypothetical protein